MNLPLDEYGAIDFNFVQNLLGKPACRAYYSDTTSTVQNLYAVADPLNALVFFLLIEHAVQARRKDMTEEETRQVYQALLARSKNGKLGKKDTTIVAAQFGIHIRSVQRLWKRGKTQLAHNIPVVVASTKKGRSGRKAVPPDLELMHNIPLKQRMTIEDVSSKLGMSKSKIQRYLKKRFT